MYPYCQHTSKTVAYPQRGIWIYPGQCFVINSARYGQVNVASMHYHLPIEGHVSVWFEEPTGLRGLDGVKENWQVPVKLLLEIAKVRD